MNNFYVIGNPISHSKSPLIFNYIFQKLKVGATYNAKEIYNVNDVNEFICKCKYDSTVGCNITMPYKESLLSIIDYRDDIVKLTKSINCIKIYKNKVFGYNNDYYGFEKLISSNHIDINGSRNIVLGSGGSARTIILFLIKNNAKSISILSRNKKTSLKIINDFKSLNKKINIDLFCEKKNYENYNLINCTPIGIIKNTENFILSKIKSINFNIIVDINYIYGDDFLSLAYKKIITGEDMFIFQAFKSLDIWFESNISNKLDYKIIKELIC